MWARALRWSAMYAVGLIMFSLKSPKFLVLATSSPKVFRASLSPYVYSMVSYPTMEKMGLPVFSLSSVTASQNAFRSSLTDSPLKDRMYVSADCSPDSTW